MPPYPVIKRLPRYLSHVVELKDQQVEWVSSGDLSRALGLTTSTVRQDLSHLALSGVSKRGYRRDQLEAVLRSELQTDRVHRVAIVGAGYLGTALALRGGLKNYGFDVCAIFDNNPEIIGTRVGPLTIRDMFSLTTVLQNLSVDMAILAVPPTAAQEVADLLVEAGVKGLMNLAYCAIRVPEDVVLIDVRILSSLQELAYVMRKNQRASQPAIERTV